MFRGVNPQGCSVTSFKAPTPVELAHDFLWRIHAHAPARGMIGIFNRSHYEDVVTVRVLELAPEQVWRRRPQRIVEFEQLLADAGTTVLKCFLHVSAEEQRERFAERLSDPSKRWKHNPKDEQTSRRFREFTTAYDEALTATSTQGAPGTSSRPIATGFGISRSRPCSSTPCGDSIRVFPPLRGRYGRVGSGDRSRDGSGQRGERTRNPLRSARRAWSTRASGRCSSLESA